MSSEDKERLSRLKQTLRELKKKFPKTKEDMRRIKALKFAILSIELKNR